MHKGVFVALPTSLSSLCCTYFQRFGYWIRRRWLSPNACYFPVFSSRLGVSPSPGKPFPAQATGGSLSFGVIDDA
jgi:hypothetical protein